MPRLLVTNQTKLTKCKTNLPKTFDTGQRLIQEIQEKKRPTDNVYRNYLERIMKLECWINCITHDSPSISLSPYFLLCFASWLPLLLGLFPFWTFSHLHCSLVALTFNLLLSEYWWSSLICTLMSCQISLPWWIRANRFSRINVATCPKPKRCSPEFRSTVPLDINQQ